MAIVHQSSENERGTLDFIRGQAETARYIKSVCMGALVLGAAGLLKGRRAATHWMAMEFLDAFGAVAVDSRVAIDGNVITGGGVTAGIDFTLRVAAEVAGEPVARTILLGIEYDPFVNASICTRRYNRTNVPVVIDL